MALEDDDDAPSDAPRVAAPARREPHIVARDLTMAFGERVILRDLDFTIRRGDIFVIMGASGSGKSTLLRHLIGLHEPARGEVFYGDESFTNATEERRAELLHDCGVMYQRSALWSSMTLQENIALPMEEFTALGREAIDELARLKLALVGLAGFEEFQPSALSGGMQKRAALARATALDPSVLLLDEPSAGLDPESSRRLDDLILELRASLGATVVVVTHELASIFAIADNGIFLDAASKTIIAAGDPHEMLASSTDPRVLRFLTRGAQGAASQGRDGAPRR